MAGLTACAALLVGGGAVAGALGRVDGDRPAAPAAAPTPAPAGPPVPRPAPTASTSPAAGLAGAVPAPHRSTPPAPAAPSARPAASASAARPPVLDAPTHTRELDVAGGRLLDLDPDRPVVTAAGGPTLPPGADVQVGPNNLYPHNGARIWFLAEGGTCPGQRTTHAATDELLLTSELADRPRTTVTVCLISTEARVYTLTVSTAKVDGSAPYHFSVVTEANGG